MNRNCTVCDIKIDKSNYLKDRTVGKSCYNKNRRKNNNINTLIQSQQPKSDNSKDEDKKKTVDSVKNRTLIIGCSNCGKTYLMNHIFLQKREPIFIITKSLNQYPKTKAQTSDQIKPLDQFENSTVVFDDLLLSKRESNIDLFSTEVVTIVLIYTT